MFSWLEAGTYCEDVYGMTLDVEEGYFVCPECGEPIYETDWPRSGDDECPVCGFVFMEGCA